MTADPRLVEAVTEVLHDSPISGCKIPNCSGGPRARHARLWTPEAEAIVETLVPLVRAQIAAEQAADRLRLLEQIEAHRQDYRAAERLRREAERRIAAERSLREAAEGEVARLRSHLHLAATARESERILRERAETDRDAARADLATEKERADAAEDERDVWKQRAQRLAEATS